MNKKEIRKLNNAEHKNVQKYIQGFEVAFDGYYRQANKSVIATLCLGTDATEADVKNFPFDQCRNLAKKALRLAYPCMSAKKNGIRLFMSLTKAYYVEKAKVVNGTFNDSDVVEVHTFRPAERYTRIFRLAEKNSLGAYVDKANKKRIATKIPQVEVEENTFYLADNKTVADFDSNKVVWLVKDTDTKGYKFAKGEFYLGKTSNEAKQAEKAKAIEASKQVEVKQAEKAKARKQKQMQVKQAEAKAKASKK